MIFGEFPLEEARGLLLAHSLRVAGGVLKKGRRLSDEDLAALRESGLRTVTGALLAAEDLDENAAAARLAQALAGPGTVAHAAVTGRSNLFAEHAGLLVVDADIINAANAHGEAVAVATLPPYTMVRKSTLVATVKTIPLAVAAADIAAPAALGAALRVLPLRPCRAALLLTHLPGDTASLDEQAIASARARIEGLGGWLGLVMRCAHRPEELTHALREALAAGCDLLLIHGATVTKDRADVVPAAIVAAGGTIERCGMPTEPGNMLVLGRIGEIAAIGLPGCARSLRLNGLDWLLQRLLAGLPLGSAEIAALGVGGLIRHAAASDEATPSNPGAASPAPSFQGPRIAAVILAAGQGTRMGGAHKLLCEVDGISLLRRAACAALASRCSAQVVVLGHRAEEARAALDGLDIACVDNPEHTSGMASSLRRGLAALPANIDGAVILLADMPRIDASHIDRLIAAFTVSSPAILALARQGRRGNPVLWPREFFAAMQALAGDTGARPLLQAHADRLRLVECDDAAIFADVDTPEALRAAHAGDPP